MPRPKSADPKRAITLRLPSSVLARYEAMGEGYRAKMEAVLAGAVKAPAAVAPKRGLSVSLPLGPAPVKAGDRLKKP